MNNVILSEIISVLLFESYNSSSYCFNPSIEAMLYWVIPGLYSKLHISAMLTIACYYQDQF